MKYCERLSCVAFISNNNRSTIFVVFLFDILTVSRGWGSGIRQAGIQFPKRCISQSCIYLMAPQLNNVNKKYSAPRSVVARNLHIMASKKISICLMDSEILDSCNLKNKCYLQRLIEDMRE